MNTLDDLFENWKNARPEYKYFCKDGILVESDWEKASTKILFLLKETYTHFIDISGPMGPMGTSKTFWRKMKMWTYITTSVANGETPSFEEALEIKETPNTGIAYVNIKKNAEKEEHNDEAYSDESDIINYAINDKGFLLKQIELINPDIIFCCATFFVVNKIFDGLIKISENIYQYGNKYVISFRHPSNRLGYEQEYNELCNLLGNHISNNLKDSNISNDTSIEEFKRVFSDLIACKKQAHSQQKFELIATLRDFEKKAHGYSAELLKEGQILLKFAKIQLAFE